MRADVTGEGVGSAELRGVRAGVGGAAGVGDGARREAKRAGQ